MSQFLVAAINRNRNRDWQEPIHANITCFVGVQDYTRSCLSDHLCQYTYNDGTINLLPQSLAINIVYAKFPCFN